MDRRSLKVAVGVGNSREKYGRRKRGEYDLFYFATATNSMDNGRRQNHGMVILYRE